MTNHPPKPCQLKQSDWQKFKDIRIQAVTECPQAFGDTIDKVMSQPDSYWIEALKQSKVFVIDDEQESVAMVVLKQDDDGVWTLKSLWTNPQYRGQGLATKLIQHVLKIAREMNITVIELGINVEQVSSVRLYESIGFRVIKTLHNLPMGDGSVGDLLVMQIKL